MGEVLEVAKVLVSPCEKLMEAVQSAIGKAYEPRYVKRMADAKAHEIKVIGEAMREVSTIPIVYEKSEIFMNTSDYDELVKRTQSRMAFQELTKQNNIESVVECAYGLLEEKEKVSEEPMDQDWILRFFNSVEDISNEKMQKLWAKILAGETMRSQSFSLRTLDVLRSLTQSEAALFAKVAPFVMHCIDGGKGIGEDFFLPNTPFGLGYDIMEKYGFHFSDLMRLSEAGLLLSQITISVGFDVSPTETGIIYGTQKKIVLHNLGDKVIKFACPAYLLSEAGKELLSIVYEETEEVPETYLEECIECIIGSDDFRICENAEIRVTVEEL